MTAPATRPPNGPIGQRRPRRRHWWRWVAGGVVGLAVILFGAAAAYIKLQPSPAPLALPRSNPVAKPTGPLDGTWTTTTGSLAGFRVQESFLGISNDVVGRTSAVTGTVTISGDRTTEASFRVDLPTIEVNGKTERAFDQSLDTSAHPYATVTLATSLTLTPSLVSGAAMTATAHGEMTMHGVTHAVSITVASRRDGNDLQVAGSIPVTFAEWGITDPSGYGSIAGLANHGTAEFSLHLRRAGGIRG